MTSIERIQKYASLPLEAAAYGPNKVPKEWPQKGQVEFEHLTLRYEEGTVLALDDLNITFNASEKVCDYQ